MEEVAIEILEGICVFELANNKTEYLYSVKMTKRQYEFIREAHRKFWKAQQMIRKAVAK